MPLFAPPKLTETYTTTFFLPSSTTESYVSPISNLLLTDGNGGTYFTTFPTERWSVNVDMEYSVDTVNNVGKAVKQVPPFPSVNKRLLIGDTYDCVDDDGRKNVVV